MVGDCNPAPPSASSTSVASADIYDKMTYDFKKLALGHDNPVEVLLSDPLQNATTTHGLEQILEESRKVDLLTSITNK